MNHPTKRLTLFDYLVVQVESRRLLGGHVHCCRYCSHLLNMMSIYLCLVSISTGERAMGEFSESTEMMQEYK
jgi:hypothetical protein